MFVQSKMVQQTRYVVEDYILHKIHLKYADRIDRKVHQATSIAQGGGQAQLSIPQPKPSELNFAVRKIAEEYERRYKENFPDLLEQIEKSNVSTRDVDHVLGTISKDLFHLPVKSHECSIKWGHLIGLLVVGGYLAVRAVELNYLEEVDEIVRWICSFFDNELKRWLDEQGGWESLVEWTRATNTSFMYNSGQNFDTSSLSSGLRSVMSMGVLVACVGFAGIMITKHK